MNELSAPRRGFDPRTLPRSRSAGRFIVSVLSLLAVIGAAAGGGYFLWKTELVRPALVRHLPPVPVTDLTLVQTANAAENGTSEPRDDAAPRTETGPVVSKPASEIPAPRAPSAGLSASGVPEQPRATAAADPAVPAPGHGEADPRPDSAAGIAIRKRIRADRVAISLERAYEAFLAGDGPSAAEAYRTVLGLEPGNRDARLGLAAVAVRAGRWDEAAEHYTRALASHPADTVARVALIAIGEQDPARAESRLKALLRNEPRAAHLHFGLGSLYAAQSRWSEARQAWFNAYRFDRGNADYAYNLAVSLDHLSQPRSALGLYREALVLSRSRPASFDAAEVRRRIRGLDTPARAESVTARPASGTVAGPRARVR